MNDQGLRRVVRELRKNQEEADALTPHQRYVIEKMQGGAKLFGTTSRAAMTLPNGMTVAVGPRTIEALLRAALIRGFKAFARWEYELTPAGRAVKV